MPQTTYEPTFASLTQFACPDWFRDAKFGIWSHWGPQSVPMCGDWYARNMYIQGTPQYLYHLRHYGHPSKFGYKDICALWKAERFDPEALMGLYHRAGARYFVGQAMHHDHFFNYPSKLNRMNSTQTGPMKDICGLWHEAAQKYGMPFGLAEHLGASFNWWRVNKGADTYGPFRGIPYDGNNSEWRDFYFSNKENENVAMEAQPWYTENQSFHKYWVAAMKELIDLYTPDLLYSDGALPFGEHWHDTTQTLAQSNPAYQSGLEVVATLYNASIAKYGENRAIYTQKDRRPEIYRVGILDIEKSQLPSIAETPWQTDTCIGNWFYDAKAVFKKPEHIIEILVDIVSKNGTMLLNILQRPDGTIDDEANYILRELAAWFDCCAEGIHGTRPFRVASEGDMRVAIQGFTEEQAAWSSSDYRFTRKENTLYAFVMGLPENGVSVIKSLHEGECVTSVRLLGANKIPFEQSFGVLTIKLPERMPTQYTNCLAITLE